MEKVNEYKSILPKNYPRVKNLVIQKKKTYEYKKIIPFSTISYNEDRFSDIHKWLDFYRPLLKKLYFELIYIAKRHGIKIINDQETKYEFIKMMYENCTKRKLSYREYDNYYEKYY